FVGNTAGSGARLALKSQAVRKEAFDLVKHVRYVELSIEPLFEEEYINSMYLPHANIEDYPLTLKNIRAPVNVKRYKKH
ncbi:MAG: ASKHA domain-containing protein, partial [Candidatus Bathyarchaeia archaeon]